MTVAASSVMSLNGSVPKTLTKCSSRSTTKNWLELTATDAGLPMLPSTKLGRSPRLMPLPEETASPAKRAVRREPLHALVLVVGDVEDVSRIEGDVPRSVELPLPRAGALRRRHRAAVGGVGAAVAAAAPRSGLAASTSQALLPLPVHLPAQPT